MSELSNDQLLQWILVRREQNEASPPGALNTIEQSLKEFAKKPNAQKVIRKFLSLKPSQQQKALSTLSTKDAYLFRRMLGPEWTKQEDLAIEQAGPEIWQNVLAYIKANPGC